VFWHEQAFLDCTPEDGAVVVLLAEVGVPGVGVRVELHERKRPVDRGCRAQFRERHRVVTAEHYGHHSSPVHFLQAYSYALVALLDVAGYHRHVAVVYDREVLEDRDVLRRVVGPEEVRDTSYALRAEASPSPEGGPRVKGCADDGHVGVLEVLDVGQPHKGARAREARCLQGVRGFVADH
jgi:hypothetical protein